MESLMRISEPQIQSIKHVVTDVLGRQVQIRLFGSRLDDDARGGDIDLYIHADTPIDRPAYISALIQAKLIREIGERKVDIILDAPNLKRDSIHQIAEQTGVAL
jgi:predicted nucleotidyltransferase